MMITEKNNAKLTPLVVLEFFKSSGEGWQSRMDEVLRNYVSRHSRSV